MKAHFTVRNLVIVICVVGILGMAFGPQDQEASAGYAMLQGPSPYLGEIRIVP